MTGKGDEIRAETAASVKLIKTSAEQIDIDPEYVRVAARKFGQGLVRVRVNLDEISLQAVDEVVNYNHAGLLREVAHYKDNVSYGWLPLFPTAENEPAPNIVSVRSSVDRLTEMVSFVSR